MAQLTTQFGQTYPLDRPHITVGSSPECVIWLDESSVAPYHAVLRLDGDQWFVSPAGDDVQVNGQPIEAAERLWPDDWITLGEVELFFQPEDRPVDDQAEPASNAAITPQSGRMGARAMQVPGGGDRVVSGMGITYLTVIYLMIALLDCVGIPQVLPLTLMRDYLLIAVFAAVCLLLGLFTAYSIPLTIQATDQGVELGYFIRPRRLIPWEKVQRTRVEHDQNSRYLIINCYQCSDQIRFRFGYPIADRILNLQSMTAERAGMEELQTSYPVYETRQ